MLAVALLVLLFVGASGAVDPSVVRVAFVHRHGTRTPCTVVSDTKLSWTNSNLTPDGKTTMLSLGTYLKNRYGAVRYNISRGISMASSSSVLRTLQSGYGVLASLYGISDPMAFPIIQYAPDTLDVRLAGSMMLRSDLIAAYPNEHDAETRALLTNATLTALGTILGQETLCETMPTQCAVLAQDVAMSYITNNVTCDPRLCVDALPLLTSIMKQRNHFMFVFMGDLAYQIKIGRMGYPVLKMWVDFFHQPSSNPLEYHHYSAHDTTLAGIYNTLGILNNSDTTSDRNLPVFGEVVVMELMSDGTVNARWGYPNQTAGSTHIYTTDPIAIRCGGRMTTSCSLTEFSDSIEDYAPESPKGLCYRDPVDYRRNGCDNVTPGPSCALYRAACPATACAEASQLPDPSRGYQCVTVGGPCNDAKPVTQSMTFIVVVVVVSGIVLMGGMQMYTRRSDWYRSLN